MTLPRPRRQRPTSALLHNPIIIAWDRLIHRIHDPRSVGYGATGVLLFLVLALSWHLWQVTLSRQQTAWVVFEHNTEAISALQEDDPVLISGVLVGRVERIEPIPGGARAFLSFFEYQKIRTDARAINFPQGLMGQRAVIIDRGASERLLPDGGAIPGRFQPGMAETMSRIELLMAKANALQLLGLAWIQGDEQHAPAALRIQQTFALLERTTGQLEALAAYASHAGDELPKLGTTARAVDAKLSDADATIRSADATLSPGLDKLRTGIGKLRPLVAQAQEIDNGLHDTSSLIARTLANDSLYRKLESLNHSVRDAEGMVSGGKVDLPFHFNLWRTFRFSRPERKTAP